MQYRVHTIIRRLKEISKNGKVTSEQCEPVLRSIVRIFRYEIFHLSRDGFAKEREHKSQVYGRFYNPQDKSRGSRIHHSVIAMRPRLSNYTQINVVFDNIIFHQKRLETFAN